MSSWQRTYEHRGAHLFPRIFVGCVLTFLGVVLGLLFFPWGFGLLILAVAVPIAIGHFGTNTTIYAGPEGFTVTTESKRAGRRHEQYGWHEVTGTEYEEFVHRRSEGGPRVSRYFTVNTARGQAFRVGQGISQFEDLIQVFNHMTPHLPYTWQPQGGFQIQVGSVGAGRSQYVRVPRNA